MILYSRVYVPQSQSVGVCMFITDPGTNRGAGTGVNTGIDS